MYIYIYIYIKVRDSPSIGADYLATNNDIFFCSWQGSPPRMLSQRLSPTNNEVAKALTKNAILANALRQTDKSPRAA